MKNPGGAPPELIQARAALLDALEALAEHRSALILVGAQAIYHWTRTVDLGITPYTLDADLALDVRVLGTDPRLEVAMSEAGFRRGEQPGIWYSPRRIQVDLLVASVQAGAGGRRGARIPGHDSRAARRARGLEGALVDAEEFTIGSFDREDRRRATVEVAGPGALLVAKVHKIADRVQTSGERAREVGKDCTDLLRVLRGGDEYRLVHRLRRLLESPVSEATTREALEHLARLFMGRGGRGARLLREAAPSSRVGAGWSASAEALVEELMQQCAGS
jgi:hypothetical protein